MLSNKLFILLPLFALATAVWPATGCISNPHALGKRDIVEDAPFDFGDVKGPLLWSTLDEAWQACATGKQQTPINFAPQQSTVSPAGTIKLDFPSQTNITVKNVGYTVEAFANATLTTPKGEWKLFQYHVHTPSEHQISFDHEEAEIHFVFTRGDPVELTVVGFLLRTEEAGTRFLDNTFAGIDELKAKDDTITLPGKLKTRRFVDLVNSSDFYSYTGSLTTPPCTEGVNWFVSTKPIPVSVKTYRSLKRITKMNSRYINNAPGQENLLVLAAQHLYDIGALDTSAPAGSAKRSLGRRAISFFNP